MDRDEVARRIKRYEARLNAKNYSNLLENITQTSERINNTFIVWRELDDIKKMVKDKYNTAYRDYLECWKIRNESPELFSVSSVFELEEAKRKLDFGYREIMKKMRGIQK